MCVFITVLTLYSSLLQVIVMSQSSVITSAGKRGRAWTCKLCPFKGERHYVLRHIYSKHLTFDEYPYVCPVCEYRHYDYSNFSKHVQWYYLHAALKGENSLPMPTSSDMSESSRIALGMLDQMSVVDSLQHWQRQRRMRTSQPISGRLHHACGPSYQPQSLLLRMTLNPVL